MGDALKNVDGRVTNNTNDITNINKSLDDGMFSVSANGENGTAQKVPRGGVIDHSNKDGNVKISQDGTNFAFDLADKLSVKEGLQVGDKGPSITDKGIDAGGKTLTNLGNGVNGTDAVNKSQLDAVSQTAQSANEFAVKYDKNDDGSVNKNSVTLEGENGTKITKLSNGNVASDSTDAINGSQLYNGNKSIADNLGGGAKVNPDGTVSQPDYTLNDGKDHASNVGDALKNVDGRVTNNTNDITNLNNSLNDGVFSVSANGTGAQKVVKDAVIDHSNKDGNVKISQDGTNFVFDLADKLSVKEGLQVGDKGPSITDKGIDAGGKTLTNLGNGVNGTDAVNKSQLDAVSQTAQSANEFAVKYDKNDDGSVNKNSVTLEGENGTKITKLSNGNVASDSTDAINGSQLYNGNKSIADNLGGGAKVNPDGTVSQPDYTLNDGKDHASNVGDALKNVDGRVTNNTNDIQNITQGKIGLVQQAAPGENITVGKDTDGDNVDFTGTAGSRKLIGVNRGLVSSSSTEAINGSQLYQTNKSIADSLGGGATLNSDGSIQGPRYTVQNNTVNNVGDALGLLDNATTKNSNDINNITQNINNGSMGLVQQDPATQNITVAKDKGGDVVDVTGTDGARTIRGVKDGKLSSDSTEAVNGSQLFATNNQVAKNTQNIDQLSENMNNLANGDSGIVTHDNQTGDVNVAANKNGTRMNIAGTDGDRTISGVKAGEQSNDAVNVSQLKGATKDVQYLSVATPSNKELPKATETDGIALGGGSKSTAKGAIAVGSNSTASGANSIALGTNSSVTGKNSVALGSGSVADRDNVVSVGSEGHERQITNVARATKSTDAVNMSQLADLQSATNKSFNRVSRRLNHLDNKLSAGVASSMALAGIPQAYQPDSSLVGAAVGGYSDKSAVAIGVSHISENGRWITKLQGSANSHSDVGGSLGIGYQW